MEPIAFSREVKDLAWGQNNRLTGAISSADNRSRVLWAIARSGCHFRAAIRMIDINNDLDDSETKENMRFESEIQTTLAAANIKDDQSAIDWINGVIPSIDRDLEEYQVILDRQWQERQDFQKKNQK
jgi:hypothetical protein